MQSTVNIFWFRRDLRLGDQTGLSAALQAGLPVLPIFIFDTTILDKLEDRDDRRVDFIYQTLQQLHAELQQWGSGLEIWHGDPIEIWPQIIQQNAIATVFANHDYEPQAIDRDAQIAQMLKAKGIVFRTFKDQVIREKEEVKTGSDGIYTVFTPYSKKWKSQLTQEDLTERPVRDHKDQFLKFQPGPFPTLAQLGFQPSGAEFPPKIVDTELIDHYADTRDIPSLQGTSRLSVHLRFGTVSIRRLVKVARDHSETWLNELIWREFYMQILANFPRVVKESFKPQYEAIQWRQSHEDFERWCQGKTGYPIVDAGMRELKQTGFMHNRVRMITASFLTKHLLLDWRWGEAWFARQLLDFELASNNGGWQWAAGTGTDAAPYFRIFNPESQTQKFDPKGKYIRQWVPEFGTPLYPRPMVDHKFARQRCLDTYAAALK